MNKKKSKKNCPGRESGVNKSRTQAGLVSIRSYNHPYPTCTSLTGMVDDSKKSTEETEPID
jgi:hypothetical protein